MGGLVQGGAALTLCSPADFALAAGALPVTREIRRLAVIEAVWMERMPLVARADAVRDEGCAGVGATHTEDTRCRRPPRSLRSGHASTAAAPPSASAMPPQGRRMASAHRLSHGGKTRTHSEYWDGEGWVAVGGPGRTHVVANVVRCNPPATHSGPSPSHQYIHTWRRGRRSRHACARVWRGRQSPAGRVRASRAQRAGGLDAPRGPSGRDHP